MLGGGNPQLNQQEQMASLKGPKLTTSYAKIQKMMKSHNWSQRAQALEDFLRYLIEMQPSELMNEFNNEKEFSPLVDQIILKLDSETVGSFMSGEVVTLWTRDSIAAALHHMTRSRFRRIPLVTATGQPTGVVSFRDIAGYIETSISV